MGLKHHLCLVTEGISDIDALSQCARKHALQASSRGRGCYPLLFVSAGLPKALVCSDMLIGLCMKVPVS